LRTKSVRGNFFYVTGNFVEFSDKVKSPPGRILSYREQDKTGFNDLVWWTVWVEKKDRKSGKKTWNCGEKSGRIRVVWKTFRKKG
jgi:hypothetical protein